MADFCHDCSIEIFGRDCKDLYGLCEKGDYIWVICEGCAQHERWPYVLVDHRGKRNRQVEARYAAELADAAKLAESKNADR